MQLDESEMRRVLRRRLAVSESAIAQHMRDVWGLSLDRWPQDVLLAHTRRGLDRAVAQGLRTQQDVLAFLVMRHQFGERFDEFPAVRDFLARPGLPPDNRIASMMLALPMAIWDVVRRRTPPGPSGPFSAKGRV
ncbi:hypothetical protein C8246_12690 [Paracidovorax avenae]|uniref:hypothetical protein n=1 Tax=Paracidovorax avenae TaxID=80867 RepID=UPI000D20E5F2|nr:hypothetical protein [Paracidovorax avenae]AVS76848.1 hypothetical protein C8234_01430 [Paracidovorax avenae]AVS92502.1 hypothetical protein C8246_12690 [Paracidovorax avenae]